jgi:hypothetical protein
MCDVVSEALDLIKHMKETEDAKVWVDMSLGFWW